MEHMLGDGLRIGLQSKTHFSAELNTGYARLRGYKSKNNIVAVSGRLPGRCMPGDFDCGFGRCVPITVFHDGKPDCHDGSDEWCFFGQVKCGAYCIDMSQALGCIFSPKCDDSSRQPQWCAVSKEKLCGNPGSFPCKGYGECVLWQWLLDGTKHCIDGSDEDQNYVRTLEGSYRCYYNRTKVVTMPPPLNYSEAFLKNVNPSLPGRPPQFPTLFPTVPSHTVAPSFTTQPPPINPSPPVHLSRITGLPPLPPPYPTLLPQSTPFNPNPVSLTQTKSPVASETGNTIVPGYTITPSDPFGSPDVILPTSISPNDLLESNSFMPNQGSQQISSATSLPALSTPLNIAGSSFTRRRGLVGHIRGRATTTMMPGKVVTHISVTVVDTKEASRPSGRQPGEVRGHIPAGNPEGSTKVDKIENRGGQPSITHIDLTSNGDGPIVITQTSTSHPKTSLATFTDSSNAWDAVAGATETAPKSSLTAPPHPASVVIPVQTAGRTGGKEAEAVETSDITSISELGARDRCLHELVANAKDKYSNYECQCAVGEMEVNGVCEGHERDLTFFKLDIHSVCGKEDLTDEQKKWVAIGKLAESLDLEACLRMTANGDAIVNSICGADCDLDNIRRIMKEQPDDPRRVTIEEAPLCEDSSSNYCHENAICLVDDVRLKCRCRSGTNDTSDGLGRECVGIPTDNDCIMILGACLIFWLIILLGILLLIPLLIFLLSHCCPGNRRNIHPAEHEHTSEHHRHHKHTKKAKGEGDYKHIAAIMSSASAPGAKITKEVAMNLALSDLYKNDHVAVGNKNNVATIEDAHAETLNTVINQPNNIPQTGNTVNGAALVMNEIPSIPGTVPVPYGETPILDQVTQPPLPQQPPVEGPAVLPQRNPLAHRTASQQSFSIPEAQKPPVPPSALSAPAVGSVVSFPREISTPRPVDPPVVTPYATPPHGTPPHVTPPPVASLPPPSTGTPPQTVAGTVPTLPPPAPPPPSFPVAVEVHRNNDPNEKKLSRTISTHSIGVQPTIWESYKALGDVYSKQDNLDRQGSSSSLDTLIYSRYPHMTATLFAPKPASSGDKRKPEKSQPPAALTTQPLLPSSAALATEPIFAPAKMDGEKSSTEDDVQVRSAVSPRKDRSDQAARLAAMLGVTIDNSSISSSSLPERPPALALPQSDEQIVEEMSKEGVELPIPPKEEPELSLDERIIQTTPDITLPSHVESKEADIDLAPVPILPALPAVPNVEITESDDSARPITSKNGRTLATSVKPTNGVFVPKKAREQKGKDQMKKAPTVPGADLSRPAGSRELLKPPDRTHSSADDSDPEVATFKRLARNGRSKGATPLARRRPRRPERQLSSISEKSAEIAAEAALQHQPQDYSISAPNTTRSLTEWQRYIPKHTLQNTSGSDSQTDIDRPTKKDFDKSRIGEKRISPSGSKTLEKQKRRRAEADLSAKSRDSMSEPLAHRRSRLSPIPSTSSAPLVESYRKSEKERGLVSSPDIPDVTFRRSLDRLDLLEGSPDYTINRGAFTSRSQVGSGRKVRRAGRHSRQTPGVRSKETEQIAKDLSQTSDEGETAGLSTVNSGLRKLPSKGIETPHSSKVTHHALISRRIATRRQETHITKSAGDLTLEPRSSSSMSHRGKTSRSADNISRRPPWNSSPYVPDDKYKIYREPFLPEIKSTSRCSSTIELSPYFSPGADSDKPPKEDLWWGPPPRSFR
ncbi:unnamed protein product [Strongylus vulgaris]|uniref:Uncharacterized protein n=1 Tax=Strongylus vulgaris TaxID=40348 RepID=A0A3P7IWP9_STRVU|nr:unnamed protein product [Strongylus vulgaris]